VNGGGQPLDPGVRTAECSSRVVAELKERFSRKHG
jgi:hypothetical protein